MAAVNWIIADEVLAILMTKAALVSPDAEAFVVPIAPEVRARFQEDVPPIGQRVCAVIPAGFASERITRGNDKERRFFVHIFVMEAIPGDPSSASGMAFLRDRGLLIEQIEGMDFSAVESASWEESRVTNLLEDAPSAGDDSLWMQVVELEFSE